MIKMRVCTRERPRTEASTLRSPRPYLGAGGAGVAAPCGLIGVGKLPITPLGVMVFGEVTSPTFGELALGKLLKVLKRRFFY